MAEEEDMGYFEGWTFQFMVEGLLMPLVALFGLVGNSLSIYILNNKEVKMKRDFVEVLCSMSAYDNLFLLCAVVLFSLPQLSGMTKTVFQQMTYSLQYKHPYSKHKIAY